MAESLVTLKSPVWESRMPDGCIAEYLFNDNLNDTSGFENNLTNYNITFDEVSQLYNGGKGI